MDYIVGVLKGETGSREGKGGKQAYPVPGVAAWHTWSKCHSGLVCPPLISICGCTYVLELSGIMLQVTMAEWEVRYGCLKDCKSSE